MYWLIEEKDQVDFLFNSGYKEVFIEVIPYNSRIHPKLNKISLIYVTHNQKYADKCKQLKAS